jgi:purine-nucleoside phosphorylase
MTAYEQIEAAAALLRSRWPHPVELLIVVESGGPTTTVFPGGFRQGEVVLIDELLPGGPEGWGRDIPSDGELPVRLRSGEIAGRGVMIVNSAPGFSGSLSSLGTFLVRLARVLGAETMIIAAAVRGLEPKWLAGEVVLVRDHINLFGTNPLIGPNDERFGPRFPDMTIAYDEGLRRLAMDVAGTAEFTLREGVRAVTAGGIPETPAERQMWRMAGADFLAEGFAPYTIVAGHCGMRVLGLGVVTAAPVIVGSPSVSPSEAEYASRAGFERLGEVLEAVVHQL